MAVRKITMVLGDLGSADADRAARSGELAWDIETTGLDWSRDRIGTCQVATADGDVFIIQLQPGLVPDNLRELLEEPSVRKVFHHAPFDLRFMSSAWKAHPASVACTKIAAKIVEPGLDRGDYSLKPLLRRYLGVQIEKDQQVSDWSRSDLSPAQIAYAANDVLHLAALRSALLKRAEALGVLDHVEASFAYLPTRVALDLAGAGDVFAY